MSLTQRVITDIRNSSGESVGTEDTSVSGTLEQEFNVSVAPTGGTTTVVLAVAAASIKAFAIVSDRAVSLAVNNPADETYALLAGKVFAWHTGLLSADPITHDVTSLVITNAGASAAAVRGVVLS